MSATRLTASAFQQTFSALSDGVVYARHKDGNIQNWELMFNALYDFNREGTIQPYVGAGIGAAQR